MKKHWKLYSLVGFLLILGLFIRLFRFTDLLNFGPEQTTDLKIVAQMIISHKPALIGAPYLSRFTATSRYFYRSAGYLYPLIPFQIISHNDPVLVTGFFVFLNILAGLGLFFLLKKIFNTTAAVIALFLFVIDPTMIYYSRMIWVVCWMVPLSVAAIYLFLKGHKKPTPSVIFWLGLVSGFGTGIHLSFITLAVFFFLYFSYISLQKKKLLLPLLYIFAFFLGNLPLFIFELRNHFYNTQVMWEYFWGIFKTTNKEGFFFSPYHFILWFPLGFLLLGLLFAKIYKKFPAIVIAILSVILLLELPHWDLTAPNSPGMAAGWNLMAVKKTASIIAGDATGKFEVASIFEGDTRDYAVRYYLDYINGVHPMPDTDYPYADTLYVVGHLNQDPTTYSVWEINSIKPVKIAKTWPIQADIVLYKLIKAK